MALLKQQGSSLLEVMISMLFGSIMLLAAVQILVNSKLAFMAKESTSRMEESGNYALNIIGNDVRSAGYNGCMNKGQAVLDNLIAGTSNAVFQPERGIQGWEASNTLFQQLQPNQWRIFIPQNSNHWSTTRNDQINVMPQTSVKAAKGSDMIRTWSIEDHVFTASSITNIANTFSITVNGPAFIGFPKPGASSVTDDRILIVSDCNTGVLVKATAFNRTTGVITLSGNNADLSLLTSMNNPEVVILKGVQYYLGKSATTGTPMTSLYRQRIQANGGLGNSEELIEGIANMQIYYGENSSGSGKSANRYVVANNVQDWTKVVSVRIWVLAESSTDAVSSDGYSYRYIGRNYISPDRRLRRGMSMTFSLRNRMLGVMP